MSSTCLNCTRLAVSGEEYCKYCLERLDEMVDNRDISSQDQLDIRGDFNPFWSSSRATGDLSDSKSLLSSIDRDQESTTNYWYTVVVIAFFLLLLIIVYL